jgi:hypothetical protein
MGYYTHYKLQVTGAAPELLPTIHQALSALEGARYALRLSVGPAVEYPSNERVKWYEHEADLRALSARFPGVLFTLSGEGQEARDLWTAYHRDGLLQRVQARIEFDPFDETRLA